VSVVEKTLTYQGFEKADEIFAPGGHSTVVPVTRIGDRSLPFRALYSKGSGTLFDGRAFMIGERHRPGAE
jgi:branched-subunit amino acid aminotransferase/4-amino-4-deoxychorismate lyase